MRKIEQIIKERGREPFYNYYRSLGYDHKTAACLALFTYGSYRFRQFSMDRLYDAFLKGEEYLPPEVLEERRALAKLIAEKRKRRKKRESQKKQKRQGSRKNGRIGKSAPSAVVERERGINTNLAKSISVDNVLTEDADDCAAPLVAACAAEPMEASAEAPASDSHFDCPTFLNIPASPTAGAAVNPTVSPTILDLAGAAGFATDEYESIEEKEDRSTAAEPTSTFRMTTNTASAGIILNQLRNDRRIDQSMIRIEEMLNYFRYDSEIPENEMFNIAYEMMDADNERKYLYINVQGREVVMDRQNIIILLDVSGSMCGNTEETQAVIATIVSKLGNGDKLSLVTYSTSDSVELEAFTVNGAEDRIRVLEKLLSIEINGCTYGSKGIERAYQIGKKNYIDGGNNQVIMITDGDLNFGITDKGGLEELIELKKKDNLFLSVIGTGLYNYKDEKLEALSKHGNGVYRVVNNLTDVKKSIDEEYSSLVNIIAKDVKAQAEFNPEVVESYRLLGFENRGLAREDFTNDRVISEPFGSGGYGVALYELKMKTDAAPADSGLKYSKLVTTGSREPGTIKVRYKEPLEDVSHELEKVIETAEALYTDNLRLAFIIYVCAEKLRGSDKISTEEIDLAKKLYQELGTSIREKNSADLFKLAGILEKSEKELGIGLPEEPFPW